jgi:AraC-like DNA-binding protein
MKPADFWNVGYDFKTQSHVHKVRSGFGHALLVPAAIEVFRRLALSAFLVDASGRWFQLHSTPPAVDHETEHSRENERQLYNVRSLALMRKKKAIVRGEHGGTTDWFVPILSGKHLAAALVVGSISQTRPSNEEILARWRDLTGRTGHLADREFSAYLARALNTLVLDTSEIAIFERLLERLSKLLGGEGDAGELMTQIDALRAKLEPTRSAEHDWEMVKSLVDDRSQRAWRSANRHWPLRWFGLSGVPDHVLVGLTKNPATGVDPIAEAAQRNTFQRAVTELARTFGDALAGQVGDHGVVFLVVAGKSRTQRVSELAERAALLARRRFGFSLHCGTSPATTSLPLSRSYLDALAAAERALSQDVRLVAAAPKAGPARSLRLMRLDLGKSGEQDADALGARFDHYLEAVKAECGFHVDAVRMHLEAGFELLASRLAGRGSLDEKSFSDLSRELERACADARTTADVCAAFRSAVSDLAEAVRRPVQASRVRSLRRALDFIQQHYTEPIRFRDVARQTGFAPNYFSELFKRQEGTTFERYVLGLRLERARQLLANSELEVARVSELSGFRSPQYFNGAFKSSFGVTPKQYRRQPGALPKAVPIRAPEPRSARDSAARAATPKSRRRGR